MKSIPLVGDLMFELLVDKTQEISPFYPRRDLSKPSLQLRQMYAAIKIGLGRHLIETLAKKPVPIITTFFFVAFMAEEFDYPGDIWCVTTDTDISRAWAPMDPKKSRINYIVGNGRCAERLKLYGVRGDRIFLTGFPLPPELIGGVDAPILKKTLVRRMCALDPQGIFRSHNERTLEAHLGKGVCPMKKNGHVPSVMFAIGGAGAQERLAETILKSLSHPLRRIMNFEKELRHCLIVCLFRIENHFNHFSMSSCLVTYFLIRGVRDFASSKTDGCMDNAGQLLQIIFDAPKTPPGEEGPFISLFRHRRDK